MRVAAAAVVAQRLHSGDADGELRQAFAPGTAKTVGDDDGDGQTGEPFERASQTGGGAVWVFREQQRVSPSVDVGDVDAAVGAEEAVMRFGNEHAVFAADDRAAFAQGEFDDAS